MLIPTNPAWENFIIKYPAGAFVDFDDTTNVTQVWEKIQQNTYYQQLPADEDIFWESEERKLLEAWEKII